MEALATLFKALSDETRLRILVLLKWEREVCGCDVEGVLGITQSKSSRHLRYLLNTGLVRNRRDGVWMHYSIPDELPEEHRQVLDTVQRLLEERDLADLRRRLVEWTAVKKATGQNCAPSGQLTPASCCDPPSSGV